MTLGRKIPNEIILLIYQFADIDTKININKLMGWSHNVKIQLKSLQRLKSFKNFIIPYISESLQKRQHKYFKYYDDKNSKLYNILPRPEMYMYPFNLTPEPYQPSGVINLSRYYYGFGALSYS